VAQRQEERLTQRLAVWVAGTDARGNRFQQTATVVNVSRLGARLGEIRCLRGPGEIVELKRRGRKAQFKVIWIDDFAGEAGVRCLELVKDFWGLPLPTSRPAKYEPAKALGAAGIGQRVAAGGPGGWISSLPSYTSTSFAAGYPQPSQSNPVIKSAKPTPPPMPGRRERQHTRHRCNGGAEIRKDSLAPASDRIWGRLTQVSLGGCFVAAMHPFAEQTKITLFLGVQDIQVRLKGIVRRSHPGMGMGVMFTDIDEQNQRGLEELTNNLAKGGRFSQFA
jgi:hypothetical protein